MSDDEINTMHDLNDGLLFKPGIGPYHIEDQVTLNFSLAST